MNKREIITIAGGPGSGKSTTANLVAQMLGYRRFSSGDFMRAIAKERGMTLQELLAVAEHDRAIDEKVDTSLRALRDDTELVIDSRLAFHWIQESFKVYLELDLGIAAERVFKDMNDARVKSGEATENAALIREGIEARLKSERARYQHYYGLDPYDHSHFDLVVDTARHPLGNVAKIIVSAYRKWLS